MPHLFSGVGVALLTLFRADGSVDPEATASHAARLVDLGMRSVLVAGSTGEGPALERAERGDLLRAVRERVPVPVIAGTGAASARQAAALTADARRAGADAALALSPPRSHDPRPYYREVVAAAEGLPVLAYHFPAMSAPGLTVEALAELRVAGVKDSSGDPDRLLQVLDAFDGPVYVGSAPLALLGGATGCEGALLAVANVAPEDSVAAFAGDAKAQRRLGAPHATSKRAWPVGLKRAVAERFGTSDVSRMG